MGVVHVDAATVGGDHVGDVELWGVGEHVRSGGGTFESGAARVVDRVLLPVVPADGLLWLSAAPFTTSKDSCTGL